MHRLSVEQFNARSEAILNRIFLVRDSEHLKFTSAMEERLLLYPCYCYLNTTYTENDEDEWVILNAIKHAARQIEDPGFYLSQLPFDEHAYVETEEIDSLFKNEPDAMNSILEMPQFWEYRLLSSRGDWAVCVSDMYHATIVGVSPFMDAVKELIPQHEAQVYDWLETINSDIASKTNDGITRRFTYEWVKPLLVNIYGETRAKTLIQEADLTKFLKYLS